MTTTVVYGDAADGNVYGESSTYATARDTGSVAATTATSNAIGQEFASPTYYCDELFFGFDTSVIDDTDTVSAAVLGLYGHTDVSGTDFDVTAAAYDWSTTVTTADFRSAAQLAALTALASFGTASFTTTLLSLTDLGGMAASVNKTGFSRYVVYSSRHAAGTTPTGTEYVKFYMADNTGTDNDPRLTVTHAADGAPVDGTITGTGRGTGNNAVSSTTLVVTPSGTLAVGSMGVLCVALDNSGSGGATAAAPATATDSVGNVWTRQLSAIYDPGLADAGAELAIYTAPILFAFGAANTLTLTWAGGVSVPSKAWTLRELSTTGATLDYVTGAAGTGAASAAPTVTTSSLTSGDFLIGAGASESTNTWAGDADTTNGTWGTQQTNGAGTGATGMAVTSQGKLVTATGTQTYNPTLTSADQIIGWISVRASVMVPPAVRIVALQAVQRASAW